MRLLFNRLWPDAQQKKALYDQMVPGSSEEGITEQASMSACEGRHEVYEFRMVPGGEHHDRPEKQITALIDCINTLLDVHDWKMLMIALFVTS